MLGSATRTWSPRQAEQRGEVPNGAVDSRKDWRLRWIAGNPAVRFDPQRPRLTKVGDAYRALQPFHWPKGTAARDKGKREIGAGAVRKDETGRKQDVRSSDPRSRSASTDRKRQSNARSFLHQNSNLPTSRQNAY